MRVLFTFAGGNGHFRPLVPIARALAAAGHTIAFTGEPLMVPIVEAAGFTAFPSGPNLGSDGKRRPLLAVDRDREDADFRDGFVRRTAPRRAQDVSALCEAWDPDLLVCDEADHGSMIVAEKRGLPHATVLVTAAGVLIRPELVDDALNEVRAAHGLPPQRNLEAAYRHLVLSPFPASFRDPRFPLPTTARSFHIPVPGRGPVPEWHVEGRPTLYFTLGTIFNTESGDLFARALAGLREIDATCVVTVGNLLDPAEFGGQPEHIHLAKYLPQDDVLPYCDAVLSHGGSGSLLGAIAYGLPMVLLPMGADQPHNGDRVTGLGLGKVLDVIDATPEDIRDAVSAVLREPSYREAAGRLRDEVTTYPPPEKTVPLLEGLLR
ncbi:glycosyltransferase [Amycolatopsis umgeniensis]|uniref:UDP:flavonoid glycosyltransferase YjiC (YdhE family) n=1 Tax=Amycolatopsis umgeniensis TaxID=336628 RepID=A0A841BDZ6_9PSEU|nr:glycosyltransferase [Amycolatopsis umgeniensis]MBB5858226.1 UDP:flavonoid glycosyltransferase YjiC (YdhE family) [Amycolatopsis umgeniensis]